MKKCVMMIAALCVFVINPMVMMSGCSMYGCGEPIRYDYSAADMVRELEAIPTTQSVPLEDGRRVEVSFTLDPVSMERVAQAEQRRDFVLELVQSAHACDVDISKSIDVTGSLTVREIPVEGEATVVREEPEAVGRYIVNSTVLDSGRLVWGNDEDSSYYGNPIATFHTRTGAGEDAELIKVDLGEGSDLNYEHPDYIYYY